VEYFLMSLKGIGKVKTRKIARRLELPPRCRLEDLKRDKLVKLSKIVEKHQ
jgi:ribosomal protein S13